MKSQVELLGWINLLAGALFAFVALIIGALLTLAPLIANDHSAFVVTGTVAMIVDGFLLLIALPAIIAGAGLLKHRSWARPLALVLAVFQLISFPIGTCIALYAFAVLLSESSNAVISAA